MVGMMWGAGLLAVQWLVKMMTPERDVCAMSEELRTEIADAYGDKND